MHQSCSTKSRYQADIVPKISTVIENRFKIVLSSVHRLLINCNKAADCGEDRVVHFVYKSQLSSVVLYTICYSRLFPISLAVHVNDKQEVFTGSLQVV